MPSTPFTAEHDALRDSVRRLVERELVDAVAVAEAGGVPHAAVLDRCDELGLLDTDDILAQVAAVEELARLGSAGIVAVVVDAVLGRELTGDLSPTAVVDAAELHVTGGRATGALAFVVGGRVAVRCVVLDAGLVVHTGRGWSCTPVERPHALRGGAVGDIALDAAACSVTDVSQALRSRHELRHAAAAVSAAWRTWEQARDYASQRTAFGRPIGRFQVNRHTLARTATQLMAAQSLVHDTAWNLARGTGTAAAARLYAGRVARDVADAALQLHGGYGYTTAFEVERAWRDAHALSIGDAQRRTQLEHRQEAAA